MLLELYIGAVTAGAVGVIAQHYWPQIKAIKFPALPKFDWGKLNVKKHWEDKERLRQRLEHDALVERLTSMRAQSPAPRKPAAKAKPKTKANPYGGSGGTSVAMTPGSGGGAGGKARITNPMYGTREELGKEILERINTRYPWVQAKFVQPEAMTEPRQAGLNMVWFTQSGKKLTAMLTVHYPSFDLMDSAHINTEDLYAQACALIQKGEAENPVKPPAYKPPDYMSELLKTKFEEIEKMEKDIEFKKKMTAAMKSKTSSMGPG